jgi:cytochrome P450
MKRGTHVYVSILNANRSTRIWGPDADEWKPERWLIPLPESVTKEKLPGVYASMYVVLIYSLCALCWMLKTV